MQNEIQKEEDMDTYTALSLKENIKIWSMLAIFAVIWSALMFYLPAIVIVGYVSVMAAIVIALWMLPRNVNAGIEDNGNFVKVKL